MRVQVAVRVTRVHGARHLSMFNPGGELNPKNPKEARLKRDIDRPYFQDQHQLIDDPSGKLLPTTFHDVASARVSFPFQLQQNELDKHAAEAAEDASSRNESHRVFLASELPVYAVGHFSEWATKFNQKYPALTSRMSVLELPAPGIAYSVLRWMSRSSVKQRVCAEGEWTSCARMSSQDVDSAKRLLRIDNKYLGYVFVLDPRGRVSFSASGAPLDADWPLFDKSIAEWPT